MSTTTDPCPTVLFSVSLSESAPHASASDCVELFAAAGNDESKCDHAAEGGVQRGARVWGWSLAVVMGSGVVRSRSAGGDGGMNTLNHTVPPARPGVMFRLLVPHTQSGGYAMLSYIVRQRAGAFVAVLFVDPQPPVQLHNLSSMPMAITLPAMRPAPSNAKEDAAADAHDEPGAASFGDRACDAVDDGVPKLVLPAHTSVDFDWKLLALLCGPTPLQLPASQLGRRRPGERSHDSAGDDGGDVGDASPSGGRSDATATASAPAEQGVPRSAVSRGLSPLISRHRREHIFARAPFFRPFTLQLRPHRCPASAPGGSTSPSAASSPSPPPSPPPVPPPTAACAPQPSAPVTTEAWSSSVRLFADMPVTRVETPSPSSAHMWVCLRVVGGVPQVYVHGNSSGATTDGGDSANAPRRQRQRPRHALPPPILDVKIHLRQLSLCVFGATVRPQPVRDSTLGGRGCAAMGAHELLHLSLNHTELSLRHLGPQAGHPGHAARRVQAAVCVKTIQLDNHLASSRDAMPVLLLIAPDPERDQTPPPPTSSSPPLHADGTPQGGNRAHGLSLALSLRQPDADVAPHVGTAGVHADADADADAGAGAGAGAGASTGSIMTRTPSAVSPRLVCAPLPSPAVDHLRLQLESAHVSVTDTIALEVVAHVYPLVHTMSTLLAGNASVAEVTSQHVGGDGGASADGDALVLALGGASVVGSGVGVHDTGTGAPPRPRSTSTEFSDSVSHAFADHTDAASLSAFTSSATLSTSLSDDRPVAAVATDVSADSVLRPAIHIELLVVEAVRVLVTVQASAPVFLSVNQMPLDLSAVRLRHVRAVPNRLAREFVANYIADAVRQSVSSAIFLDMMSPVVCVCV